LACIKNSHFVLVFLHPIFFTFIWQFFGFRGALKKESSKNFNVLKAHKKAEKNRRKKIQAIYSL
jgi:hypothetical protein